MPLNTVASTTTEQNRENGDPGEARTGVAAPASPQHTTASGRSDSTALRVAVYSDRIQLRADIHAALGERLADDLPPVELVDYAWGPTLARAVANGEIDMCILDAETAPLGGMGLSYQLHEEVDSPPPILLLLQRRDDAWIATWSRAEAVYPLPVHPFELARAVTDILRTVMAQRSAIAAHHEEK
ncbi:MAG: response regulator [Corynebacterium sp.]|nr:response regulator [Corynebacterium sp.]